MKINKEPLLGAHMSIAGGVSEALQRGASIGCRTIQIFSRNANQWRAKAITKAEVERFRAMRKKTGIHPVIVHDSYLINLASPEPALYEKSLNAFYEEMERAEILGCEYLVFHPGAYRESSEEEGLARIAKSLNLALKKAKNYRLMLLLETTAGQGTGLGHTFEQLACIIDRVKEDHRIGVCYDTCHTFAAGYDIRDAASYRATFREFAGLIGLDRLKVFHFNDSKKALGSRVDRHEHIGRGAMGQEPFRMILQDRKFGKVPKILETPKGPDMKEDVENLQLLRKLAGIRK